MMKRVRMLLRVSSDKQLEKNGDLDIQRQILKQYIEIHKDWKLDSIEYFEGSKSAYKNTSSQREILQTILQDAKQKEFDILVPYKDDRVGRLMWDTSMYVMELKKYGVDIYTVKDGCISPDSNDIMGQMLLTLRYANAQKSSLDTGMRVKDTAAMLVKQGKYVGGRAPYGYVLKYSGEISKHGRALKKLVIDPSKKQIIQEIFRLSNQFHYGPQRIANYLNQNPTYIALAPKEKWYATTINSILTNPIYAGKIAYKRRERKNGSVLHNNFDNWIMSQELLELKIISFEEWKQTQEIRCNRKRKAFACSDAYTSVAAPLSYSNKTYELPFTKVLCPYCEKPMKTKKTYNYWTLKNGEKQKSVLVKYYCNGKSQNQVIHNHYCFCQTQIQQILYESIANYLEENLSIQSPSPILLASDQFQIHQLQLDIEQIESHIETIASNIRILEHQFIQMLPLSDSVQHNSYCEMLKNQNQLYETKKALLSEKQQYLTFLLEAYKRKDQTIQNEITWSSLYLESSSQIKNQIADVLIQKFQFDGKLLEIHYFPIK